MLKASYDFWLYFQKKRGLEMRFIREVGGVIWNGCVGWLVGREASVGRPARSHGLLGWCTSAARRGAADRAEQRPRGDDADLRWLSN